MNNNMLLLCWVTVFMNLFWVLYMLLNTEILSGCAHLNGEAFPMCFEIADYFSENWNCGLCRINVVRASGILSSVAPKEKNVGRHMSILCAIHMCPTRHMCNQIYVYRNNMYIWLSLQTKRRRRGFSSRGGLFAPVLLVFLLTQPRW